MKSSTGHKKSFAKNLSDLLKQEEEQDFSLPFHLRVTSHFNKEENAEVEDLVKETDPVKIADLIHKRIGE